MEFQKGFLLRLAIQNYEVFSFFVEWLLGRKACIVVTHSQVDRHLKQAPTGV